MSIDRISYLSYDIIAYLVTQKNSSRLLMQRLYPGGEGLEVAREGWRKTLLPFPQNSLKGKREYDPREALHNAHSTFPNNGSMFQIPKTKCAMYP